MERSENINVRRNWEVCRRGAAETRWTSMYVSINKLGDIIMNRIAYEALGRPDSFELLFDRERYTIGLKPARLEKTPDAFPVKHRGRHGGHRIRGNRLLREFGVSIGRTLVFDRCQMDNHGILILDLRMGRALEKRSTL